MDTIYAWAAGFIDGEGTITLKRTKAPSSATKIHYQPYVALGQANHVGHYEAVRLLKELFGGSIYEYHPKPPRVNHLTWRVVSQDAIKCLEKVRPYLKVKQRHADLIISYYQTAGQKPKKYRLSEEEIKRRENIWEELRSINQKGKIHLQRLSEMTAKTKPMQ